MGRGRTTTGMIIAALLHLRKVDAFPIGKKPDLRGENERGPFFLQSAPSELQSWWWESTKVICFRGRLVGLDFESLSPDSVCPNSVDRNGPVLTAAVLTSLLSLHGSLLVCRDRACLVSDAVCKGCAEAAGGQRQAQGGDVWGGAQVSHSGVV